MTTATLSAYPRSVEELLPAAREMTVELGGVPSRNQLMRAFKVGAPKATDLRQQLIDELGTSVSDHTPVPAKPATSEPDPVPVVAQSVAESGEPAVSADPVAETEPLAAPDGHPASPLPAPEPVEDSAPMVAPDRETELAAVRAVSAVRLARKAARVDRAWRVRHTVANRPARPVQAPPSPRARRKPLVWPVLLLSLPAFVAIWSGWVELGELAGFGIVHPLPGIADDVQINTAITLPIGVETYAAYALWVWLSGRAPRPARRFAKWSALGSLVFGAAGQIAYHLLASAGVTSAPWQITSAVACLPVAVLGMGAALAHLMHADDEER